MSIGSSLTDFFSEPEKPSDYIELDGERYPVFIRFRNEDRFASDVVYLRQEGGVSSCVLNQPVVFLIEVFQVFGCEGYVVWSAGLRFREGKLVWCEVNVDPDFYRLGIGEIIRARLAIAFGWPEFELNADAIRREGGVAVGGAFGCMAKQ